jgi:cytochrome c
VRVLLVIATIAAMASGACRGSAPGTTDGRALFEQTCARCHGSSGEGDPAQRISLGVPDLTDPAWQAARTDDDIRRVVREGSKTHKMPGFNDFYKPAQLDALARHVRSLAR